MDSTNETNKYRWYVLRAVTQQEDKIKKHIESEIKSLGLEEFVPRVLVPVEKVFTIRNGKKVMKEKNFYSGYVFVEAYFVEKEIEQLEVLKKDLLEQLNNHALSPQKSMEISQQYADTDALLEEKTMRWLELSEKEAK